jgi:cysteine synthase
MKDRMALGVISRAQADSRLSPGDTVVEYTGGTTGASLSFVCAAQGYKIHVVSSKAFSQEKLDQMVAFGAKLTLIPYDGGHITKQLILDMIAAAANRTPIGRINSTTPTALPHISHSAKKSGVKPTARLTPSCNPSARRRPSAASPPS